MKERQNELDLSNKSLQENQKKITSNKVNRNKSFHFGYGDFEIL